jgi:hypothetical protein
MELPTHPAALDEIALLAQCHVRRQRRSGPGGQHRNKVETAVVITHGPTGERGEASERRSQEQNRRRALFRLRLNLALAVRHVPPDAPSPAWTRRLRRGKIAVQDEHEDFPGLLAEALDMALACQLDAKVAAERLGCTPSQLVKLLQREPRAIAWLNEQRQAAGKPAYR